MTAMPAGVGVLSRPAPLAPRVEGAPPLPSPEMQLLIFGGKGGVGKTTLACATALRLAAERPDREVLLVSTDPAPSVSVCLDQTVGPEPTRVCTGLAAMEIDAQTEFETLKRQYAAELERVLASVLPNLDLTFDRHVMERILDLSPPGLDEVMALSRAAELLAAGTYDLLVLDAAPTGHLVRLLEMPELIDRWLKVLFEVLLKYRNVLRLPDVSERLVRLSRNLKRVRALLADPRRAALYTVTIPTEMAYEETRDLLAACERLVSAPVVFINLTTPGSDCPLCCALRCRESRVEDKLASLVPRVHRALVYRCREPQGQERLRELGRAMYLPR
ncbi:MAG: ArsA family ATPase [Candidatus Rokubacteria bacterium]|nr:ArsA family ATPase [Candidatus Rokubacteria bacterium]